MTIIASQELLKGISWGAAEVTKVSKVHCKRPNPSIRIQPCVAFASCCRQVEGTASYGKSRKGNFFYFEYRLVASGHGIFVAI